MILYHATTRQHYAGIVRDRTIRADKARDRRKAVWLHASFRSAWAALHTVRRHGGRIEDVIVLRVKVSRGWITRHARGLWFTYEDIDISRVMSITGFRVMSESEVKE